MYTPTRNSIKRSLLALLEQHSMDEITVRMVCDGAGISRQALYNHYYCLPDVLEEALVDRMNEAAAELGTYHTWSACFEAILNSLLRQKAVLLHVYRSNARGELMGMLENYGARLVKKGISQCAEDMGIAVTEQDRTFMLRLYMHTFMGVIGQWLEEGMQLSPEFIASRCDAMMGFSIRGTLRRLYGSPEVDSPEQM